MSCPTCCSSGRVTRTLRKAPGRFPGVLVADSDRPVYQSRRLCEGKSWKYMRQSTNMPLLSVPTLRLRLVPLSAGRHIVDGCQPLAMASHLCTDLLMLVWGKYWHTIKNTGYHLWKSAHIIISHSDVRPKNMLARFLSVTSICPIVDRADQYPPDKRQKRPPRLNDRNCPPVRTITHWTNPTINAN